MTTAGPASLELRNIDVNIDQHEVLRHVDLQVLPGELFVLLGISGSGKSTLLRAIAGLDPVEAGGIWIDDREITDISVPRRRVALMFQSFPLWPHLSVAKNIGFSLRRQHLPGAEIKQRVEQELTFFGLSEFARHLPRQLSASQRQRVALARTLVAGARINLLDEPLQAQEYQMRQRLLQGLKRRQQQSAVTTVLATQNQDEALRIADRIAVLHDGEVQQVGTPMELYDMPRNRRVAECMGSVNLIEGEVEYAGEQALFHASNGIIIPLFDHPVKRARSASAMFRPQDLSIVDRDGQSYADRIRFRGRIEQSEFLGEMMRYGIDVGGKLIWMDLARTSGQLNLNIGDSVTVAVDPARIRILED